MHAASGYSPHGILRKHLIHPAGMTVVITKYAPARNEAYSYANSFFLLAAIKLWSNLISYVIKLALIYSYSYISLYMHLAKNIPAIMSLCIAVSYSVSVNFSVYQTITVNFIIQQCYNLYSYSYIYNICIQELY